ASSLTCTNTRVASAGGNTSPTRPQMTETHRRPCTPNFTVEFRSCYMVSMGFKARPSSERQLWDSLTPMPQKTALLLMRGELSREEMAEELGCGVKTFDSHRLALMQH